MESQKMSLEQLEKAVAASKEGVVSSHVKKLVAKLAKAEAKIKSADAALPRLP
jgi:hypothetical protein